MIESVGRLFSPIPEMLCRNQREAIAYLINVIEDDETRELLKPLIEVDPYCLPDECGLDVCALTPAKHYGGLVQGPCRILQETRLVVDRETCSEPVTAKLIKKYLKSKTTNVVEIRGYSLPLHNGRIIKGIPSYCSFEIKSVLVEKEGTWEGSWISSRLNNNWYRLPDSMKIPDKDTEPAAAINNNIQGILGSKFPAWHRGSEQIQSKTKVDFSNLTESGCKTERISAGILNGILHLLLRAAARFSGSPNLEGVPVINESHIKLLLPTSVLAVSCPWWLTTFDLKQLSLPDSETIALCYVAYNKKGEIYDITEKGTRSRGGWLSGIVVISKDPTVQLSKKFYGADNSDGENPLEEKYFCMKIADRKILDDGTARVTDYYDKTIIIRPLMPSKYPFLLVEEEASDLPSTPTQRARVGRSVSFGSSLDIEGSDLSVKRLKTDSDEDIEQTSIIKPATPATPGTRDTLSRLEATVLECARITNKEKQHLIDELPSGKLRSCCATLQYQGLDKDTIPYFRWMVGQEWLFERGGLVIGYDLDLCTSLLDVQPSSSYWRNTLIVVSNSAEAEVWSSALDAAYPKKRIINILTIVDLCGKTPGDLVSSEICILHRDVLSNTSRLSLLSPSIVAVSECEFENKYNMTVQERLVNGKVATRPYELELISWQRVIVTDLSILTKRQQLVIHALQCSIKWIFSSKNLAFISVLPSAQIINPKNGHLKSDKNKSHKQKYEDCLAFSTHHMLYIGGLDDDG